MQQIAVIRLLDGRLAWYPPGASDEPVWLDNDTGRERLRASLAQRRGQTVFAAPGAEVRLQLLWRSLLLLMSDVRPEIADEASFANTFIKVSSWLSAVL